MWTGIKDTKFERNFSSASLAHLSNALYLKMCFSFTSFFLFPSHSCLPEYMFVSVNLNHFICSLDAF